MREAHDADQLVRAIAAGDDATLERAHERRVISEFQAATKAHLAKLDRAIAAGEIMLQRMRDQRAQAVNTRLAAGVAVALADALP